MNCDYVVVDMPPNTDNNYNRNVNYEFTVIDTNEEVHDEIKYYLGSIERIKYSFKNMFKYFNMNVETKSVHDELNNVV